MQTVISDSTQRLTSTILAVCPIAGVSGTNTKDSSKIRIDFDPIATDQQKDAAQAVLQSFDWSDAAQAAWEKDQLPQEQKDLNAATTQILADIATYNAIIKPTLDDVSKQTTSINNSLLLLVKLLTK